MDDTDDTVLSDIPDLSQSSDEDIADSIPELSQSSDEDMDDESNKFQKEEFCNIKEHISDLGLQGEFKIYVNNENNLQK